MNKFLPSGIPVGARKFVPAMACINEKSESDYVLVKWLPPMDLFAATRLGIEALLAAPSQSKQDFINLGYEEVPGVDIPPDGRNPGIYTLDRAEVWGRYALMSRPNYAREDFEEVFTIGLEHRREGVRIWRSIQVPSTYSFWDLYVAIQGALGWSFPYRFMLAANGSVFGREDRRWNERREYLPCWEYQIADYLSRERASLLYWYNAFEPVEFGGWLEGINLRDRSPGVTYPRVLRGEGFPPMKMSPLMPELEPYGPEPETPEFDRDRVVFEDPDDIWMYEYVEAKKMSRACDGGLKQLAYDRIGFPFPIRGRQLCLSENLVEDSALAPVDGAPDLGMMHVVMTKKQLKDLVDAISTKMFETQNIRLQRRLDRLSWYLETLACEVD